jgi:hypothetical protein
MVLSRLMFRCGGRIWQAALYRATFPPAALAGQMIVVSQGWFVQ